SPDLPHTDAYSSRDLVMLLSCQPIVSGNFELTWPPSSKTFIAPGHKPSPVELATRIRVK
ncbi:hypothetical protein N9122_01810, partial [Akkermansiaceae bacterium]|nr:hypothetical protein [Akkermansiaceae bacterium]